MEAAVHADRATLWVTTLRDYPHKLLYPIDSGDAFGDTYAPTPEHAYASPAKWALAALWTPWWIWAVIITVSTALYIASLSVSCRGCCCKKPACAVCLSKAQWSGLAYTLCGVAVVAFAAVAVVTPLMVPTIAIDAVGIAEDMHDYIVAAVDTAKELRNGTQDALVLTGAWRDAVNQSLPAYAELSRIADELNTTARTAADIVTQVDRDFSIQDYIDRAHNVTWYLVWGSGGYMAWLAVIVAGAAALVVYRGVRAPPRTQSGAVVLRRDLSCGAGWLSCLGLAFLGSLLCASLVLFALATAMSGVCYAPYDYVNVFVNSGNLTATADPESVPTFYATCTDATHGPVNEKIDIVYDQLANTTMRVAALRELYANTDPANDAVAAQVYGNLTSLELAVNATRSLLDCRRVHEFAERILDQTCDRLIPTFLWITILQFMVALSLPLALLCVVVSYRGDGLGDAALAKGNELAPLTTSPSLSDRPFG